MRRIGCGASPPLLWRTMGLTGVSQLMPQQPVGEAPASDVWEVFHANTIVDWKSCGYLLHLTRLVVYWLRPAHATFRTSPWTVVCPARA